MLTVDCRREDSDSMSSREFIEIIEARNGSGLEQGYRRRSRVK